MSTGRSGNKKVGTARAKPKRRRRAAAEVRELILMAAQKEFELRGYGGATTRAIAERAGTTEALLFRHFQSKANLFELAVAQPLSLAIWKALDAFREDEVAKTPQELEARLYVESMYDVLHSHRKLLMALLASEAYEHNETVGLAGIRAFEEMLKRAVVIARQSQAVYSVDIDIGVRFPLMLVLADVLFEQWLFKEQSSEARSKRRVALADFIRRAFMGVIQTPERKSRRPGAAGARHATHKLVRGL